MTTDHYPGKGCQCAASDANDCCCPDADWSRPTFVVTAYRWGLRDAHSYVVGAYDDLGRATEAAETHATARAGKYGIEVIQCMGPADADGMNSGIQLIYLECSYYGAAGRNSPACHSADNSKPALVRYGLL